MVYSVHGESLAESTPEVAIARGMQLLANIMAPADAMVPTYDCQPVRPALSGVAQRTLPLWSAEQTSHGQAGAGIARTTRASRIGRQHSAAKAANTMSAIHIQP